MQPLVSLIGQVNDAKFDEQSHYSKHALQKKKKQRMEIDSTEVVEKWIQSQLTGLLHHTVLSIQTQSTFPTTVGIEG